MVERRAQTGRYLRLAGGIAIAAALFFPVYVTVLGAFKTGGQFFSDPFGLPSPVTLEPLTAILVRSAEFWRFFFNSLYVAFMTIMVTVVCSAAAGIALSRIRFRGRALLFNFFVMGMLFPLTVAILPLYLQLRTFGLLGTREGVVLAQAAFSLPLSIFIFTGFFRDVPWELQDAVAIDGGGIATFALRVCLPLSTPVISTVTVITLIQSWNQFLLPLVVLDNARFFTIPLGVMQFQGQFTTSWNLIMAFITVSTIPMALLYVALQKYVVAGLTAGATKG